MTYIRMSHVLHVEVNIPHMDESCTHTHNTHNTHTQHTHTTHTHTTHTHIRQFADVPWLLSLLIIYIWTSHVPHVDESHLTYAWVVYTHTQHILTSYLHTRYSDVPWLLSRLITYTRTSHIPNINESHLHMHESCTHTHNTHTHHTSPHSNQMCHECSHGWWHTYEWAHASLYSLRSRPTYRWVESLIRMRHVDIHTTHTQHLRTWCFHTWYSDAPW